MGRPKMTDADRKVQVTVYVTPADRAQLEAVGCGNPSLGVRIVLARARGEQNPARYTIVADDPDGQTFRVTGSTWKSPDGAKAAMAGISLPHGCKRMRVGLV